jgi:hypothetical protein
MSELLIVVLVCTVPVWWTLGRLLERRRWENQRAAMGRVLVSQSAKHSSDAELIEQQCTVIRDQRHLLEVLTVAAEQVSDQRHGTSEAMHRLSWAATKSRRELL